MELVLDVFVFLGLVERVLKRGRGEGVGIVIGW